MLVRYWTWTSAAASPVESGLPFGPLRYRAWTSASAGTAESGLPFGPLRFRGWTSGDAAPPAPEPQTGGGAIVRRRRFAGPASADVDVVELRDGADIRIDARVKAAGAVFENRDGSLRVGSLRARARPTEKSDVVAGRARAGLRARGEVVEARDRAEIAGAGLLRSAVRITECADGARATVATSWADALAIDADDMLFHG